MAETYILNAQSRDLTGKKVISEPRQETIRKRLEAVLDGGAEKPGRNPLPA